MGKSVKSAWILLILLIFGGILGSLLGDALRNALPFLDYGRTVGFSPFSVDLAAVQLTLGFVVRLNIASIIGFCLALLIYTRL